MTKRHLIVDNLDINYREIGGGSVVLLLHGWGTNFSTFNSLIDSLGQKRRFITLDLPGFGDSEEPNEEWSVSDYAAFVRSFLDKLSVDQPQIIIGHSLGGRIAIKSVANKLFKPDHLILIASAGVAKSNSLRNILFKTIAKVGKILFYIPPFSFLKETIRKELYRITRSRDYLNAGHMKGTLLKIIKENLTEEARKVKVPTLLIWGEKDIETPLKEAYILSDVISDSKLEIIPQAGHFVHQDKTEEVAEKVILFTGI